MTPDQEEHLARIKTAFITKADAKFRAGAKEHGGDLQNMPIHQLLTEVENEVIDMYVYLRTLKEALGGKNTGG